MKTLNNFLTKKMDKQTLAKNKGGGAVCTTEQLLAMMWNFTDTTSVWFNTGYDHCGNLVFVGYEDDDWGYRRYSIGVGC